MTIYYRGRGARITHEVFELYGPPTRWFPIAELEHCHVVPERAVAHAVGAAPVTVCSSALGAVAAFTMLTGGPVLGAAWISVASVAVLAACLAVAVVSTRLRARPMSLFAIYRGRLVRLYTTADRLEFRQVCRALLRSRENWADSR